MLQRARRSACKDEDGFCSEVEKLIDEYHFEVGAVVSLREGERIQFELWSSCWMFLPKSAKPFSSDPALPSQEGNSLQMSRVRFTSLMGKMLSLSKKYCVELDPSFVSVGWRFPAARCSVFSTSLLFSRFTRKDILLFLAAGCRLLWQCLF